MGDAHWRLRHGRKENTYPTRPSRARSTPQQQPVGDLGFPISFAKKRRVVLVLGETDSGKTLFIRLMIYCNRNNVDQVIVFSETATYESPLRFTDSIVSEYKPEIVDTIVNIQDKRLKLIGKDAPVDKLTNNPIPHILLVFDDLDIDYSQDPVINSLVTRHRHLYISIIFSVQYYTMVSRKMRSLCSYLCLRTIRGRGNMEELYDFLSQFFEDFKQFRAWSIVATRDFSSIVFYLRGDQIWDEDVFEVRHDPETVPYFRIGQLQKRMFAHNVYNSDVQHLLHSGAGVV